MKSWSKGFYACGAVLGLSFCEARNEVVYNDQINERQKQACGDALAVLSEADFESPQEGGPLCSVKACLQDASRNKEPVAVVFHITRLNGPLIEVGFESADPHLCRKTELSVTRYFQL